MRKEVNMELDYRIEDDIDFDAVDALEALNEDYQANQEIIQVDDPLFVQY